MTATVENDAANLRKLLHEIYTSACIRPDISNAEWDRIHDAMLDAAEGRPFKLIGYPFPQDGGETRASLRTKALPIAR